MGITSEQFSQRIILSRQMLFKALKSSPFQTNADGASFLENETADAVNSLLMDDQLEDGERTIVQNKKFSLLRLLQLLFKMEDLLPFERRTKAFKPMMLAQLMAENLLKEWALAEHDDDSVLYYGQRLIDAEQQFNRAQRECVNLFMGYHQHIAEQDAGFHALLKNYLDLLNDALGLEKDSRVMKGWVAYLPWHELLIRLSKTLFAAENMSTSPEGIELDKGLIAEIAQGLAEDNQSRLRLRKADYKALSASVQNELTKVSTILSSSPRPIASPAHTSTMTAVNLPSRYMFLARDRSTREEQHVLGDAIRPNRR